jgi:hypothetical protein
LDSVSPASKVAARTVNNITGGNDVRPGAIDVSPETLDNVVNNLTGSAGKLIKDTAMLPFKAATGKAEINSVPFVRKYFGSVSDRADGKIYRENRDDAELYAREFAAGLVDGKDNLLKMARTTKRTESALRKLRKSLRTAKDMGNTKAADAISDRIRTVQRNYNKTFNRIVYR